MRHRTTENFPAGSSGRETACQCRRPKKDRFLGQEDPLEEGIASHSSIPAWRIPWTEEPGRLQSMGSQTVGHDWRSLAQHTENKKDSVSCPGW